MILQSFRRSFQGCTLAALSLAAVACGAPTDADPSSDGTPQAASESLSISELALSEEVSSDMLPGADKIDAMLAGPKGASPVKTEPSDSIPLPAEPDFDACDRCGIEMNASHKICDGIDSDKGAELCYDEVRVAFEGCISSCKARSTKEEPSKGAESPSGASADRACQAQYAFDRKNCYASSMVKEEVYACDDKARTRLRRCYVAPIDPDLPVTPVDPAPYACQNGCRNTLTTNQKDCGVNAEDVKSCKMEAGAKFDTCMDACPVVAPDENMDPGPYLPPVKPSPEPIQDADGSMDKACADLLEHYEARALMCSDDVKCVGYLKKTFASKLEECGLILLDSPVDDDDVKETSTCEDMRDRILKRCHTLDVNDQSDCRKVAKERYLSCTMAFVPDADMSEPKSHANVACVRECHETLRRRAGRCQAASGEQQLDCFVAAEAGFDACEAACTEKSDGGEKVGGEKKVLRKDPRKASGKEPKMGAGKSPAKKVDRPINRPSKRPSAKECKRLMTQFEANTLSCRQDEDCLMALIKKYRAPLHACGLTLLAPPADAKVPAGKKAKKTTKKKAKKSKAKKSDAKTRVSRNDCGDKARSYYDSCQEKTDDIEMCRTRAVMILNKCEKPAVKACVAHVDGAYNACVAKAKRYQRDASVCRRSGKKMARTCHSRTP